MREAMERAAMSSHALPTLQDLHGSRYPTRLDVLMHESVRNAVEVLIDRYVIIDVDACLVVARTRRGSQAMVSVPIAPATHRHFDESLAVAGTLGC